MNDNAVEMIVEAIETGEPVTKKYVRTIGQDENVEVEIVLTPLKAKEALLDWWNTSEHALMHKYGKEISNE
jgi:hypothetical protein